METMNINNQYKKKYLVANILLFTCMACLFFIVLTLEEQRSFKEMYMDSNYRQFFIGIIVAFNAIGFMFLSISQWINKHLPLLYKKRKILIGYYLFMAFVLLLINYISIVVMRYLINMESPFSLPDKGVRILIVTWLIELIITGLLLVNNSIRYALSLSKESDKLRETADHARYTALQNQLNPHFLFNSLNTLIAEIEFSPKDAAIFARKLSDVYRYILQGQRNKLVPLREELTFLNSYIFLHQVRLGSCLTVDIQLTNPLYDRLIPPLSLQLLAENVIKHNTISRSKPMHINIMSTSDNEYLVVSNKLCPKKEVEVSGEGLKNLSSRYKLMANKDIIITKSETTFMIQIPLLHENN
jgi:sensor histidine kinase YesM